MGKSPSCSFENCVYCIGFRCLNPGGRQDCEYLKLKKESERFVNSTVSEGTEDKDDELLNKLIDAIFGTFED